MTTDDARIADARYFPLLDATLDEIVEPFRRLPEPTTLLFSGGVDSSLLALELRSLTELELLAVGRRGSPDLEAADSAARILGLTVRPCELDASDVEAALERYRPHLVGSTGPARAVAVAFALALERARHRRVLSAQGIDELFLGYHHFRALEETAAALRAETDLTSLTATEWPRARALAESTRHDLRAPFLDARWVDAVRSVPIEDRRPRTVAKPLFRAFAEHRGLPSSIAQRPKRAMQYGSRVHQMLGGR